MKINSIEYAQKFASELDKAFVQKAVTGFLADNVLKAKFVGAKTVVIPNIDFVGLVDYDRDNGFNRAAVTVANEPFTMSMDRARSVQIDREDMDETGIANLAGQVMGEYVRTQVVPESDAYVLSKLAGIANTNGHTVAWNEATPYKVFTEMVRAIQDAAGYDEEIVAFVDSTAMAAIDNSEEFSRSITVSDFKQGDVNIKVKSINGVTLIPVSSARMKSAFNFVKTADSATAGGFTPDGAAKDIHMLVLPKKAASLVKKTEKMRIWTPDQNLDADAYKFDYRVYYDVFVKKSKLNTIYASFGA
jgi:hypothetical protein